MLMSSSCKRRNIYLYILTAIFFMTLWNIKSYAGSPIIVSLDLKVYDANNNQIAPVSTNKPINPDLHNIIDGDIYVEYASGKPQKKKLTTLANLYKNGNLTYVTLQTYKTPLRETSKDSIITITNIRSINSKFTYTGPDEMSQYVNMTNIYGGTYIQAVFPSFEFIYNTHTHSYTKKVQDKAPTCTAAGSGHYECPTDGARNGATYSIPALGHSYGAWSGWAKYGNTTNHRRSRKCSRCGNIEYSYENHKDTNNDGACDTCGEIYRSRHTLSIKGFLNGVNQESINPYGLFTLKIDGRNIISNQTSWSGIIADGTAYTITPTANTGYQYMGIQGGSLSQAMPVSDQTVRLSFDNLYTIVFNGNNATGGSTSSIISIPYTTAKNLTANGFYRNGYTFKCWNTKSDGTGTSYSDKQSVSKLSATPNGTVTLYAEWQPVTYHIYYTLFGSSATVVRSYNIESATFILPKPSLNGYIFKGWVGGIDKKDHVRDASGKTYSTPIGNVTIPKGTYGDYFFRAVFEKNHSVVDCLD